MTELQLDRDALGMLFPAYICVATDGTIAAAGPALLRLGGEALIGQPLATAAFEVPDLAAVSGSDQRVTIRLREPPLSLSGNVLPADGSLFLALGILPECSGTLVQRLKIADFAPSDPVVAAIMQSGIQAVLLAEAKEMALQLAAERQRVIRLLGRISRASSHMAHEFNNLISIIGLNCDRLLRDHAETPAVAHPAKIIQNTAQRGAVMTQSMMALADAHHDADCVFSIDELLVTHRAYFSLLAGPSLLLEWQLGCGTLQVQASRSGFIDWLAQMITGTRAAGADRMALTVATRVLADHDGPCVAISLAGEGYAIGENSLGWPCEELGAFLAEAGGAAELDRRSERDATLTIRLPIVATTTSAGAPTTAHSRAVTKGCRLLIVEDEPDALEALEDLLGDFGYSITACGHPDAALAALRWQRFDAMLTDVIMPGMSGFDLAEEAVRIDPGLQIVLMSGYLPDTRNHDWQFIRKPLNVRQLNDVLSNYCGSRCD